MTLSKHKLQSIYRRRARHYDLSSKLYRLLGLDVEACRRRAVELLRLAPGDVVVDLGCGTGMNFELILERIGPDGRLLGVDFSPHMLARAREKVKRRQWRNVALVASDIEAYQFPPDVNRIISTNVFGFVGRYDDVIRNAARALAPGGRMVIQDARQPDGWPPRIFRLVAWLGRPYGITAAFYARRPWESVAAHFHRSWLEEMFFGLEYIACGQTARANTTLPEPRGSDIPPASPGRTG